MDTTDLNMNPQIQNISHMDNCSLYKKPDQEDEVPSGLNCCLWQEKKYLEALWDVESSCVDQVRFSISSRVIGPSGGKSVAILHNLHNHTEKPEH